MTLVVPNNGEGLALANFLNKTAPQNQTMMLYSNNITPAETDTTATYTEATFTGLRREVADRRQLDRDEGAPSNAGRRAADVHLVGRSDPAEHLWLPVQADDQRHHHVGRAVRRRSVRDHNNGDNIQVTPQITFD
jgi:hypothetical protein